MPLEFAHQHNGQFPDPGPWKHAQTRPLELSGSLGLDALPSQHSSKVKRSTFALNLMVVGESGLGKTTFMNTLFNTDLKEEILPKNTKSTQTVSIEPSYYELAEGSVTLNLCVVDTPGFGDELNREHNLAPIIKYINQQYEEYMTAERHKGFRSRIPDTRIHALLYFIGPNGHGLKEHDAMALETLSQIVNVIPIVAKADTMTSDEKKAFKSILLQDFEDHGIKTFPSSYPDEVDGAEELLQHVPFCVIGSDTVAMIENRVTRCRTYRWGVVEVENTDHSDFVYLRELLMSTCLHDLVESTHRIHYHQHRAQALRPLNRPPSIMECDDTYEAQIEGTQQQTKLDMERREEAIRQSFVQTVHKKEVELKTREETLNSKKAEMAAELDQARQQIEANKRELEEMIASMQAAQGGGSNSGSTSRNGTLTKTPSKFFKAK